LGNDSSLDLAVDFFSVWCDRIKFINENDCWAVLFSLFKSFSEISFSLAGHLGHDLWTINQEKEGASLICNSSGNESLSGPWWAIKKHSSWWLDTQSLEQLRMSQRKFNHFSDQCHLFSAASDIIVSNLIELFFVFSVDGFSFSKKHGVRSHDTEILWLSCNNLELNWLEVSSDNKEITLLYWSVCVLEVWDQVCFGEVASDSFNSVLEWENVNFSKIGDFSCSSDLDNVTKSDSEIFSDGFVHSDFSLFEFIIDEGDNESLFSFFALDQDGVAFEDFEFGHFGLRKLDG
jgi:hypothetical protein